MLLERQTALADAPLARSSWPLSARLLAALSRDPLAADFAGGTQLHVGDHALDFLKATVPQFIARIQGKRVLDYGCGFGDQALSMKRAGAASVVGYDVYPKFTGSLPDGVTATSELPTEKFDIVLCSSSFEHFATPELELERMRALSSGSVIISWAEPWFSHAGSHAGFFTRVPWVNLLFPERSVMLVRSLYRDDGAVSYETGGLGGGVNRMTVSKFEDIIGKSGLRVEMMKLTATKGLPFVTRIPVIRELLTSACTCILTV